MHKILSILLLLCLILTANNDNFAQKSTFVDHKPQYKPWQNSYILDKIEYTEDRTIFFFRFVSIYNPRTQERIDAVFYPRNGEYPWYLKAINSNETFELIEIRNVKRNNELIANRVLSELRSNALIGQNTVFSCEIHFPRLPNHIEFADLIEGRGQERNDRHFNCFKIKLKTEKSKDLGKKEDSENTVKKFNQQFNVKVPDEPKVEPKPEPKVEPKPEPKVEPKVEPKPDPSNPYPIARLRDITDIQCDENIIMDKIKFVDDSDEFMAQADAQKQLLILLDYLTKNSNTSLTIYGHTDIFGNPDKNLELSRKRARKIQTWLTMKGINVKRIQTEWFGGTKPINEKGDAVNRRVEFKINCK